MKKLFSLVLLSLSLQGAYASEAVVLSGKDCYVAPDQLIGTRDIYFRILSWTHTPPAYSKTMTQVSPTELEFRDPQRKLFVKVLMKFNRLFISITADHASKNFVQNIGEENGAVSLLKQKRPKKEGDRTESIRVSCTPGLNHQVEVINQREEREMDRLGPQAEWHDPSAASLTKLPLGTIFELKNDLDTEKGTHFVEEHGQMSQGQFLGLRLPFRLAHGEFHPVNNGYLARSVYPKGSKLKLKAIEVQPYSPQGHGYILRFENLSPGVKDPITWMSIDGRRSGSSDVKIPQMVELLESHFRINVK